PHRRGPPRGAGAPRPSGGGGAPPARRRPAEAAARAVPGHWEGALLEGARHASAIATLVERQTRYVILVALPDGKVSEHVVAHLAAAMRTLPDHLRATLTWDQGSEMARHSQF